MRPLPVCCAVSAPPRVELDHTHGFDAVDVLVEPFDPCVPCRQVSLRFLFYLVRLGSIRVASGCTVDIVLVVPRGALSILCRAWASSGSL